MACISVTLLAVYIVGGGYLSHAQRSDVAFWDRCDAIVAMTDADVAAMSVIDAKQTRRQAQECIDRIRGN